MNGAFEGGPKKHKRRHSYDESVDKPPKLIENEPVGIERSAPLEDNEPVETVEDSNDNTPAFEN
jgi:hypothetical protein